MPASVQTKHASGTIATVRPQTAGAVHAVKFRHTFTAALLANTILEMGPLVPYADIVGYRLIPEGNFGAVTVSGGLMTGEAGSSDNTRTVGTELFSAATALNAVAEPNKATAYNIVSTEAARGIGLAFSAQVDADPTKKLTLILFFRQ